MADTCTRSPGITFRRSIRRPAAWSRPYRHPKAALPEWRGRKGALWVGQHRNRKIHQVDPQTGAILRTIESNRFVTGVTWVDGELWHGTWESDESELRRIDPQSGEVLEQLDMPPGVAVSGLESDGNDTFFCGGGKQRQAASGQTAPSGLSALPNLSCRIVFLRNASTLVFLERVLDASLVEKAHAHLIASQLLTPWKAMGVGRGRT